MNIENLKLFKRWLVLKFMQLAVNLTALVTFYFNKKNSNLKIKLPVYVPIKKGHLIIGGLSILSARYFIGEMDFILIVDYKIKFWDKTILKLLGKGVQVISVRDLEKLSARLSGWNKKFFDSGWQGKKFFVPLMYKNYNKVIIMDPDTIFCAEPKTLKNWIHNGSGSMHLKDCGNYVAVSGIEAEYITNNKIEIKSINTGLILLDLKSFWRKNKLNHIDKYIYKIIKTVYDRKTQIIPQDKPFLHINHLLEQTLFWLTLDITGSRFLDRTYFVFGRHIFNSEKIGKPAFIHFAGELNKKSLYRYLYFSLLDKLKMPISKTPWFIGTKYCENCWHIK